MGTPFDGRTTKLAVQKETVLGGASVETVYTLAGQVAFSLAPVLDGTKTRVNVWRQKDADTYAARYWQGGLEFELGANLVTKLLFDAFFEAVGTSDAGGGHTRYDYRPRRLADFGSLKFGIEFPGGPYYVLSGGIIDAMQFDIKAKAIGRLRIDCKFVDRVAGTPPVLGATPTPVLNNPMNHFGASATLNAGALTELTNLTVKFSEPKTPARFGPDKKPTRYTANAGQDISGELVEYFSDDSTVPDLVVDQTNRPFTATFADADTPAKRIIITLPRAMFDSGAPDTISPDDLIYRATFAARLDSGIATETLVSLVL